MKVIFTYYDGIYKSDCGNFSIERTYNIATLYGKFMLVDIKPAITQRQYADTVESLKATAQLINDGR